MVQFTKTIKNLAKQFVVTNKNTRHTLYMLYFNCWKCEGQRTRSLAPLSKKKKYMLAPVSEPVTIGSVPVLRKKRLISRVKKKKSYI